MKITIVGSSTAAWLSAFVLSYTTQHEIIVIETAEIPPIGVGEGATGVFSDLINGVYFPTDINVTDFKKALDCTPKLAIEFKGWTDNDYCSPIDGTPTAAQLKDSLFLQALAKNKTKYHVASSCGYNLENNKLLGGAFHFDTTKVASFFRPYCKNKGVKVINGLVEDVVFNDVGDIKSLVLNNKEHIDTDFVIDATGFHRAIFKHLNYRWIDYADHLPMNRAIPFRLNYEDLSANEFSKLKASTIAQAMSSGWLWKIPTAKRMGCGYVFSDAFLSDSEAQKEINTLYGREIETFKPISFRSGRLAEQLIKNCLAVGLSGAFTEPLQATSIHTTIIQIINFASTYCIGPLDQKMRDKFNNDMARLYDGMRDFLVLHYANNRTDTKFWKMISEHKHLTPLVKEMIEYSKKAVPNFSTMNVYFGSVNHQLWNWTLAGLGYLTPELAQKELDNYTSEFNLEKQLKEYRILAKNKLNFQQFIKGTPMKKVKSKKILNATITALFPEPMYSAHLNRSFTQKELDFVQKNKNNCVTNAGNLTSKNTYLLNYPPLYYPIMVKLY